MKKFAVRVCAQILVAVSQSEIDKGKECEILGNLRAESKAGNSRRAIFFFFNGTFIYFVKTWVLLLADSINR